MTKQPDQLGFDTLLADAATENRDKKFARATAHLPGTVEEGIAFYRSLIEQNHTAMLAADEAETRRLRKDARNLAVKLNGGDKGILAHDDAPGYVLARETIAEAGTIPLWGQTGSFTVRVADMTVRIEIEGLFGSGSGWSFWPGFAAHAVDLDAPFLSETGYRSFLGIHAEPVPGLTPDTFAAKIIEAFVARDLDGKLVRISKTYRDQRRRA
ncbi:MAG: hypothetical protein AAGH74_09945 [Pseudomonadota bacterium]